LELPEEHRIEERRARLRLTPERRELAVEAFSSTLFLVAAALIAVLVEPGRPLSPAVAVGFIAAFALALRVKFEVGSGWTTPEMLVFVPMLFVLPPSLVPLCVAAAKVLDQIVSAMLGQRALRRAPLAVGGAWFSLAPALVFVAAETGAPSFDDWPIYLAALGAQIALDAAVSTISERVGLGVPVRAQLPSMPWVYLVDVLLAPVGLLIAIAVADAPLALAALVPLFVVLALLARERTRRIDQSLELSRAYKGTALMLGEVIEADDGYTGAHSREVVELALAVAAELGLGPAQHRNVEFGALLHDVGKLGVPKEIINKPGPLDARERALIERHTLTAQHMLDGVGGVLGEAGRVVRSSHERYDGGGYPDGLAGRQIPIEARICSVCDAYSAMTTDRPYREALPKERAIAELRAGAGSQFDPEIVEALATHLRTRESRGDAMAAAS
jgi:hypothetical protein